MRLARNIYELISAVEISLTQLENALTAETIAGRGAQIIHLSPYSILVKLLFDKFKHETERYLKSNRGRFKLFIPREVYDGIRFSAGVSMTKIVTI